MTSKNNEPIEFTAGVVRPKKDKFDYISASALHKLAECPRNYAIEREPEIAYGLYGIPPSQTTYYMVFGSIFHKAMEVNASDEELKKLCEEAAGEIERWDASYKGPADLAVGVRSAVNAFYEHPLSRPWKEDRANSRLELRLDSTIKGIAVMGVIDCIDGQGQVIDLKTCGWSTKDKFHGTQLGLYHWLAEKCGEKVNPEAKIILVHRPKKPTDKPDVELRKINALAQRPQLERLIKKALWLKHHKEEWSKDMTMIHANPNSGLCKYCKAKATAACPETNTEWWQ